LNHSVTIENDFLKLEVWPKLGGKVSSIIDKADGYELLFNYPAELPGECMYGKPYDQTWYAGWDECFPAVGSGAYVGHPYDHINIPDHGEVYSLPCTAVPTKNGITTVSHGLRFGYRFARKIELLQNKLVASYTAVNLSPFEFRFVWAQHALCNMDGGVEIDLADGAAWRHSHGVGGAEHQKPFTWPMVEGRYNISRPQTLPADGWKVFSVDAISSPARIRYPKRGRKLEIVYTSESVKAYWGLWLSAGGWSGQYHYAMEPTTGRFDQLDRCIQDQSAARIAPLGTVEWQTVWTVGSA
jgi:hypothetical protein